MVFQLEFNNPLYVSSGNKKNELLLEIVEPRIFQRKASGITMTTEEAISNTLFIELQTQAKSEEAFEEA